LSHTDETRHVRWQNDLVDRLLPHSLRFDGRFSPLPPTPPRLQRDGADLVELILGEFGIAANVQRNERTRFGLRNEAEPPGGVGMDMNPGTIRT